MFCNCFPKCNERFTKKNNIFILIDVKCSHSDNIGFSALRTQKAFHQKKTKPFFGSDDDRGAGLFLFSWWWLNCTISGKFYNLSLYYAIFVRLSVH